MPALPAARSAFGKMLLTKNILMRRASTLATVRASLGDLVGRRAFLCIPPPAAVVVHRDVHLKAICSPLADYAKLEASTTATPLETVMSDLFPDNAATPTTVLEQLEVEDIIEQEEHDFARDEQQQQEDYPGTMCVMSASSTPHNNHSDNQTAKVHYDEAYDEHNLHMMPSEANTSHHHEVMDEDWELLHSELENIEDTVDDMLLRFLQRRSTLRTAR